MVLLLLQAAYHSCSTKPVSAAFDVGQSLIGIFLLALSVHCTMLLPPSSGSLAFVQCTSVLPTQEEKPHPAVSSSCPLVPGLPLGVVAICLFHTPMLWHQGHLFCVVFVSFQCNMLVKPAASGGSCVVISLSQKATILHVIQHNLLPPPMLQRKCRY